MRVLNEMPPKTWRRACTCRKTGSVWLGRSTRDLDAAQLVASGKLRPASLVAHRFALGDIMKACDTFGNAAQERALKVVLTARR